MSGSHMSLQSQIDSFIKACKTGDLLRVQELLNAAADLDASRSTSQIIRAQDDFALQCAAANGHEAVCQLLIEYGADIHADDDYALRWAAIRGREAVCRLLIEHGANIHADDDQALQWAANNGHEAVCRLLIEHGANIHARDDTALRWAAENGHKADPIAIGSICQLLLELDPLMAKLISPKYSKEVLRVFQAYGDHDAITEALMGSSRRSPFTDDENDYIASCFISRKSAI